MGDSPDACGCLGRTKDESAGENGSRPRKFSREGSSMATFERIDRSQDTILRNLYEHYVHDMSEWLGIDTRDDGAFGVDTTPCWQDDCAVYLAKLGASLAGFGVVASSQKWLRRADGRELKDFFVLLRFRHQVVASAF